MDRWEPEWSHMQSDIRYLMDSLSAKVDRSEFDNSIDRLKQIIQSMTPGNSNVTAAFDSTDLKEAVRKLQIELASLTKEFKSTQTLTVTLQADLSKLTIRVDKLEDLLSKLSKTVTSLS